MSLREATDSVTSIFPGKNWRPFFAHHCHFFGFHSGVTPWRVSPRTFFTCPTWLSTVLCKFSHNFVVIRVSPPGGYHRGWTALPLVTPLFSSELKNKARSILGTPLWHHVGQENLHQVIFLITLSNLDLFWKVLAYVYFNKFPIICVFHILYSCLLYTSDAADE